MGNSSSAPTAQPRGNFKGGQKGNLNVGNNYKGYNNNYAQNQNLNYNAGYNNGYPSGKGYGNNQGGKHGPQGMSHPNVAKGYAKNAPAIYLNGNIINTQVSQNKQCSTVAQNLSQKEIMQREQLKSMQEKVSMWTRKREYLDLEIAQIQKNAEDKLRRGDTAGAKLLLARKKAKLNQATNCDNSLMTLENQINSIDGARINADLVQSLNVGNKLQQDMQKDMDPDKVADIMDKHLELKDQLEETNQIISSNVETVLDDVEDELLALQEQIAGEKRVEVNEKLGIKGNNDLGVNVPTVVKPDIGGTNGCVISVVPEVNQANGNGCRVGSIRDEVVDELAALQAEIGA